MGENGCPVFLKVGHDLLFCSLVGSRRKHHTVKHVEVRPIAAKKNVVENARIKPFDKPPVVLPCFDVVVKSPRRGSRCDGPFVMTIVVARRRVHFNRIDARYLIEAKKQMA